MITFKEALTIYLKSVDYTRARTTLIDYGMRGSSARELLKTTFARGWKSHHPLKKL